MIKKDASNLSLVVQGPYNDKIVDTIKGYLSYYPKIEIIVVSWENNVDSYKKGLKSDLNKIILIEKKDPGGQSTNLGEKMNVNRQLVSTISGIRCSTRQYLMKLRSDVIISISKTIATYNSFKKEYKCGVFKESILVLNLTTINPDRAKRLFALNDWVYLGLHGDINKLINTESYPESYLNYFFEGPTSLRYKAEQWMILSSIFGEEYEKKFNHSFSYSKELKVLHNKFIKHFIVVGPRFIGLTSFKYNFYQFSLWNSYTFKEWKKVFMGSRVGIDLERGYFKSLYFVHFLNKTFKKIRHNK